METRLFLKPYWRICVKLIKQKYILKKNYGQYHTGFSDHTIGISAPAIAVGIGAEIIEKHIKKR